MTGNELRAQRLARGLTQRQVAEANRVSPSTVSDWERGNASVPPWLHWPAGVRWCEGVVTSGNAEVGMRHWYVRVQVPIASDPPRVGTVVQIRWTEATS